MGLVIRHADASDADALVAVARAVAGEPEGWLLADSHWRSVSQERRYIRLLRCHPDAALLLAELDGEIVGRLSVSRDPHPSSAHVADLGLMVSAAHRRRGIASALMGGVEEWARAARISKLELHVFPYNAPARALYAKLGYREEGLRHRQYRRPDGQYVDAILMAKLLD